VLEAFNQFNRYSGADMIIHNVLVYWQFSLFALGIARNVIVAGANVTFPKQPQGQRGSSSNATPRRELCSGMWRLKPWNNASRIFSVRAFRSGEPAAIRALVSTFTKGGHYLGKAKFHARIALLFRARYFVTVRRAMADRGTNVIWRLF
jgi:hypothetical protein